MFLHGSADGPWTPLDAGELPDLLEKSRCSPYVSKPNSQEHDLEVFSKPFLPYFIVNACSNHRQRPRDAGVDARCSWQLVETLRDLINGIFDHLSKVCPGTSMYIKGRQKIYVDGLFVYLSTQDHFHPQKGRGRERQDWACKLEKAIKSSGVGKESAPRALDRWPNSKILGIRSSSSSQQPHIWPR